MNKKVTVVRVVQVLKLVLEYDRTCLHRQSSLGLQEAKNQADNTLSVAGMLLQVIIPHGNDLLSWVHTILCSTVHMPDQPGQQLTDRHSDQHAQPTLDAWRRYTDRHTGTALLMICFTGEARGGGKGVGGKEVS